MGTGDVERRRHPRERFMSTLEYALISDSDIQSFKCSTANISEASSGFCIYSRGALSGGQEIIVRKSDLPFRCKKARVLWASKISEKLYVAGLRCAETG